MKPTIVGFHDFAGNVETKAHAVRFIADERFDQHFGGVSKTWTIVPDNNRWAVSEHPRRSQVYSFVLGPPLVQPKYGIVDEIH